jgi:tRNA-binding protein
MKPEVSFDAFIQAEKLEIVYGQVKEVAEVPKSDKLLNLTVDFGDEFGTKTILSAIKQEVSDPESIKGNCFFFVLNFPKRKMMGIDSEGMIVPFRNSGTDGKMMLENSIRVLPLGTKLF